MFVRVCVVWKEGGIIHPDWEKPYCALFSFNQKKVVLNWIFNNVWLKEYHSMDPIPCSSLSTDTVEYSNWTMVFRILSGSSQKVYATWNRTGQYDDYWVGRTGMQLGCVTLNGSRACKTLFRSRLLDTWSTAAVKKVRIFTVHHFHNSKTWHLSNIHSAKPNKHKRQLLLPFHWKSRYHSVSDSSRANISTKLWTVLMSGLIVGHIFQKKSVYRSHNVLSLF